MRNLLGWSLVLLMLAGLLLAGCSSTGAGAAVKKDASYKLEKVGDTGLSKVILTALAFQRIGVKTVAVQEQPVARRDGALRRVVPYASILYDAQGKVWVYTNPEPLVYLRHAVTIDFVDGANVVLSDGPPAGVSIVTTGAVELFGAETGVGK
jgi:hypothetical protein